MRASTELFLWHCLALADQWSRPSLARMGESFESWAWNRGLGSLISRLEDESYIEADQGKANDRIYSLTRKGVLSAWGGADPFEQWGRPWDGVWRFFLFDLPASQHGKRKQLLRTLKSFRLGCLQRSVWVSPDSLDLLKGRLQGKRNPESLILIEGIPKGGERDREIVRAAWDWEKIGHAWRQYEEQLKLASSEKLEQWAKMEQTAWRRITRLDPFLPERLLPEDYRGRSIASKRLGAWKKKLNGIQ